MPPWEMGSHRESEQRSDMNEVLGDDRLVWHCKTSWRTLRLELGKLAITTISGLPWWPRQSSFCLQCGRPGFNPWVGKIPWRREWQPTLVFLPGKSHGQRSLVGYGPWGCKESDMTERLHFHNYIVRYE